MAFPVQPEILLGPPGTGKTTEILRLLEEELASGTPPNSIALVTFTRKGATEAMERACAKFSLSQENFPYFRTLHSLCFRWLGLRRDDVLEGPRLRELADYAGVRLTGRWADDGTMLGFAEGDRIIFMENMARVRKIPLREQYDENDDELPWSEVERVAESLRVFKIARGLYDYTDMLRQFVEKGAVIPAEVVFVDESQDLSSLQWDVVHQLCRRARRVVIAGDDDQSIFAWAGADTRYMVNLPGKVRVLDQSWRVPQKIQTVAEEVITQVRHRRPKEWSPRREPDGSLSQGIVERAADFSTVDLDQHSDILVLARNSYVLREQVEPELRHRGIVYDWAGKSSVDPAILEAIKNWEKLRAGASLLVEDVRGVYKWMSSGRGITRGQRELPKISDDDPPMTIDDLVERGGLLTRAIWHEALDRLPADEMSYILAARSRGESLNRENVRIRLSTIHASKGGQADHVVLLTEMARRTFKEWESNPEDEARVWYVGLTRAKERLTIVSSQTSQYYPL